MSTAYTLLKRWVEVNTKDYDEKKIIQKRLNEKFMLPLISFQVYHTVTIHQNRLNDA